MHFDISIAKRFSIFAFLRVSMLAGLRRTHTHTLNSSCDMTACNALAAKREPRTRFIQHRWPATKFSGTDEQWTVFFFSVMPLPLFFPLNFLFHYSVVRCNGMNSHLFVSSLIRTAVAACVNGPPKFLIKSSIAYIHSNRFITFVVVPSHSMASKT